MVNNKLLEKLSQNLLEVSNDNEYYDITIEVGSDPHVKIFRAHAVILYYRSPYLKRILSTNKKKNDGTLVHIELPNIIPEIFQIILRYIYGGILSLEEYDASDIIKLLVTANELNLQELILHLQSFLIKNKANWLEQNFNLIYQMSFEDNSFLKLQKYCTELMSKEPEKIFKSPDFTSISEKSLTSIIQHDNFQMSEVQVWKYVLKWGLAQNPELPSDLTSFSKDDFNSLKNTLQQCIRFINFYNLTSKEFFSNVLPYKKILPKDLREDLVNHFLNPDIKKPETRETTEVNAETQIIEEIKKVKSTSIDSKIITFQHAELISEWIDRLEIAYKIKNSYEFKLLLRGSRDGFSPKKFHEICDNQSHIVSIIKVKNSNEILGGYNPIGWKSDHSFSHTNDSFIFSFKNSDSIENYILSRVERKIYAIYNHEKHGPSFGFDDLLLGNNFYSNSNSYCRKNSYEKPIRKSKGNFFVEEYEIFQIMNID